MRLMVKIKDEEWKDWREAMGKDGYIDPSWTDAQVLENMLTMQDLDVETVEVVTE